MVASGEKKGSIDTFWKCPWVNKKRKKKRKGGVQNWGCGCLEKKKKKKIKEAS